MRKRQTKAEDKLWQVLRRRGLKGLKFRRQAPVERFVVDFYCHKHRLVVELDGSIHDHPDIKAHDQERQAYLEACGYRIMRFQNEDVLEDIERVLTQIVDSIRR